MEKLRFAPLIRVSTEKQERQGDGLRFREMDLPKDLEGKVMTPEQILKLRERYLNPCRRIFRTEAYIVLILIVSALFCFVLGFILK
jgi:hypothetical protein